MNRHKDLSINQQTQEIYKFIKKINKLKKSDYLLYRVEDIGIEYIEKIIIGFFKKDDADIYEPIEDLAKEIEGIIKYNEDITIFTKYIKEII